MSANTVFRLRIPDGAHDGLERVVLGPEFNKCIVKDADGQQVLIVRSPGGEPVTIRNGMEVSVEQAEAILWHFTANLGGRRTAL